MNTDTLEFKIGEEEQPATVQLSEDGNAEILDKPQAPEVVTPGAEGAGNDGAELDQYSANVQKRIDKLTARLRETQRREQAALEYAKSVQARAQQLEQQYQQSTDSRLNEAKSRVETQLVALKQIMKKAREEGDLDTETEAQQRLASLTFESGQIESAIANRPSPEQQQAQQQQMYQQPVYQQPVQQVQRFDPKVEEWAEKNSWYGKDTVMTHAAWGIHRQLVEAEGVDPTTDEYYDELDKRIRQAFPRKFASAQNGVNRNVQAVAPASRTSGINQAARRTVRLTPSQVAIAKKLGVPLEEYAKYVKE